MKKNGLGKGNLVNIDKFELLSISNVVLYVTHKTPNISCEIYYRRNTDSQKKPEDILIGIYDIPYYVYQNDRQPILMEGKPYGIIMRTTKGVNITEDVYRILL